MEELRGLGSSVLFHHFRERALLTVSRQAEQSNYALWRAQVRQTPVMQVSYRPEIKGGRNLPGRRVSKTR